MGHSMGGMLAVRFARTYPQRTTHLVLENPIGLEDYRLLVPPQPTETIFQNELKTTEASKIRAFLQRYVVDWKPEIYERFVEVRARVALGGEYPRWAGRSPYHQMIYRSRSAGIRIDEPPTLLVIGQEDGTRRLRSRAQEVAQSSVSPALERRRRPPSPAVDSGRGNVGTSRPREPDSFHRALLEFKAD